MNTNFQSNRINKIDRQTADGESFEATMNLFTWHKNNEEGLWLDDGMEDDIEMVRKLQFHPWIHYSWPDVEDDDSEGEKSDKDGPDEDTIQDWVVNVEASRRTRVPQGIGARETDEMVIE